MRRAYGSLTVWVALVFVLPWPLERPVQGQVDVDWIPRQGTLSTAELVATLEKSQAALLQARRAVDSALLDIDEALASLRGATLDEMAEALPEPAEELPAEEGFFSRLASKLDSFRAYLGEATAGALDEMTYAADSILEEIALQVEEPESPMPGSSSTEPQTPAVAETSSALDEASPAPAVLESAAPDERADPTPSSLEASDGIEAGAAVSSEAVSSDAMAPRAMAPQVMAPQESPARIVPSSSAPANEGQPTPAPSPEAGTEEPVKKEPLTGREEKTEAVPAKEPCRAEDDYGDSSSGHRPWGESIPVLP